jgi:hypothetical protein
MNRKADRTCLLPVLSQLNCAFPVSKYKQLRSVSDPKHAAHKGHGADIGTRAVKWLPHTLSNTTD